MNTGSIRIDPYAMCEADRHTGTSRFAHCASVGTIARKLTGYGAGTPICTSPSLRTRPPTTTR